MVCRWGQPNRQENMFVRSSSLISRTQRGVINREGTRGLGDGIMMGTHLATATQTESTRRVATVFGGFLRNPVAEDPLARGSQSTYTDWSDTSDDDEPGACRSCGSGGGARRGVVYSRPRFVTIHERFSSDSRSSEDEYRYTGSHRSSIADSSRSQRSDPSSRSARRFKFDAYDLRVGKWADHEEALVMALHQQGILNPAEQKVAFFLSLSQAVRGEVAAHFAPARVLTRV